MAKYQQYAEYKNSGVEWLGEIPSHWILKKHKYIAVFSKGKNPELLFDNYSDGLQPYLSMDSLRGKIDSKYAEYKKGLILVEDNQPLIIWDGSNSGEFVLGKQGILSSTMASSSLIYKVNNKFYWYTCICIEPEMRKHATGMGIPHVNGDQLKGIILPLPNFEEQEKIAAFLNHETAKIDRLIAKQEQLIQLLQEKRQAVISHAVTKGLNPDAPMKDSGVEWLGQVPEHWIIGRLKNVLSIKNGRDYKNVEVEEGGYPVYGSGGIFKRSSDYLYDGISILFGRKGTIDKPLLVNGKFWTVDTMFYSELSKRICPEYVYFQSLGFPFNKLSTNTALPSMTQEDLLNLGFVIPPIEEQIEISNFVTKYLEKNLYLLKKAQSAIQLMQERRTALISAAVTGKIDVRDWPVPAA